MAEIAYNSEAFWKDLRREFIGASEASALFNANPYLSQFELFHSKKTPECKNISSDNKRTKWGQRLEAPIAEGLAEDNKWVLRKAGYFVHDKVKGMGCSPDFIITNTNNPELPNNICLEIKHLLHTKHLGDLSQGQSNDYIEIQLQHQMACTNTDVIICGYSAHSNTPDFFVRKRDDEFIKILEERVANFWALTEAPRCEYTERDQEILKKLYQKIAYDGCIDMSGNNSMTSDILRFIDIKEAKKPLTASLAALEKEERILKSKILEASKGASGIKVNGLLIDIKTINKAPQAATSYQLISIKESL